MGFIERKKKRIVWKNKKNVDLQINKNVYLRDLSKTQIFQHVFDTKTSWLVFGKKKVLKLLSKKLFNKTRLKKETPGSVSKDRFVFVTKTYQLFFGRKSLNVFSLEKFCMYCRQN